ncbi:MAG TPA: hypothetical protein VEL11_11635 [Candidatus Bathyarchaeia archaeon]|nr:hypothetical protein [Candidatus Bathyarchaeia archaeon]
MKWVSHVALALEFDALFDIGADYSYLKPDLMDQVRDQFLGDWRSAWISTRVPRPVNNTLDTFV